MAGTFRLLLWACALAAAAVAAAFVVATIFGSN
jgi:hypothetical protein